jgi:heme-degrading monooxygenase HmoA
MPPIWTHGVWTVKAGREDEFVAAWQEMAQAGLDEFAAVAPPQLLRDRERPRLFVSFGPWDSVETIDRFRAAMGPRFEAIERELLESFEATTLDEVPLDG